MNETINTLLVQSTEEYMQSDKLKQYINEQAESCVNEAVKEAFRWNGNLKTQIEDVVKNQLSFNTSDLGMEGTNKFLTEILTNKLKQVVRVESKQQIEDSINQILSPIDKVVSLNALQGKLLEAADTSDHCGCGDSPDLDYYREYIGLDEVFTFIVEPNDNPSYEWVDVYFDKDTYKSTYECKYSLTVHKSGRTTYKVDQQDCKAMDMMSDPYKWDIEDLVYSMFLNNCTLDYEELLHY